MLEQALTAQMGWNRLEWAGMSWNQQDLPIFPPMFADVLDNLCLSQDFLIFANLSDLCRSLQIFDNPCGSLLVFPHVRLSLLFLANLCQSSKIFADLHRPSPIFVELCWSFLFFLIFAKLQKLLKSMDISKNLIEFLEMDNFFCKLTELLEMDWYYCKWIELTWNDSKYWKWIEITRNR